MTDAVEPSTGAPRGTLDGKVALVTGSTSGIGAAIAAALGRAGATVVVNGRSRDRVDAAIDVLAQSGIQTLAAVGDVSHADSIGAMVARIEVELGRLDVVVNNAGIPMVHESSTLGIDDWEAVLRTNLTGPFLVAQAAYPSLSRRGGVIVNISSIFGHVGMAQRAAYAAAKHGLEGLTKTLAVEWAPVGIRVVSVSPGYIATPLIDRAMEAGSFDRSGPERRAPLGRLGNPDDVAELVAFVSSDRAAYITGTSVTVDGGWLANGSWC